jgi:hypothetical protein
MGVYPWIPITVFSRRNKNCIQAGIAGRRNFYEFEDSSDIQAFSSTPSTISTNYADEVSKYGCNKVHSTEIFYLLAWWCPKKNPTYHKFSFLSCTLTQHRALSLKQVSPLQDAWFGTDAPISYQTPVDHNPVFWTALSRTRQLSCRLNVLFDY